jgi:hypothetical protein
VKIIQTYLKGLTKQRDAMQKDLNALNAAISALGGSGRTKRSRKPMSAATKRKIGRAVRARLKAKAKEA